MKPQTSNLFREELRMLLNKSAFIKPQNMILVLNMKYKKYINCQNNLSFEKILISETNSLPNNDELVFVTIYQEQV